MYHPFSRAHLYSVMRITAVFDDYGVEKPGSGIAFFLKCADGRLYLVSNRHVLDTGYSDECKKLWRLKRIELRGHCEGDWRPFSVSFDAPEILMPVNFVEDVAAIDVTGLSMKGDLPGAVSPLNDSYVAREADYADIEISDMVAFPVYHGREDRQPIMRTGWIASDPSADYSGEGIKESAKRIVIEGWSWGGASGAPVFTMDRALIAGGGVSYGGGFRGSKMIGINAGHLKAADRSGAHAGLSYLIKSSVLVELLGI